MTPTYILDTDIASMFMGSQPPVVSNIVDPIFWTVISLDEVYSGWYSARNRAKNAQQLADTYRRLAETWQGMKDWPILPYAVGAIARYDGLKKRRLNVRGNDLRIAAIALEFADSVVVTRNLIDFQRIPGITCEDWSV
jgi:tRNA(fMet)-specific endonuclease VapC